MLMEIEIWFAVAIQLRIMSEKQLNKFCWIQVLSLVKTVETVKGIIFISFSAGLIPQRTGRKYLDEPF